MTTSSSPPRDVQRQRVYDAEQMVADQLAAAARGVRTAEVAGQLRTLPLELVLGSLEGARVWVADVHTSAWFAERYPRAAAAPLVVRRRRGNAAATYELPGTIALPVPAIGEAWALRAMVVAHEVAHHATFHDRPGVAAHGSEYAGALWYITRMAVSPEVGLLLAASFDLHGVRMVA